MSHGAAGLHAGVRMCSMSQLQQCSSGVGTQA